MLFPVVLRRREAGRLRPTGLLIGPSVVYRLAVSGMVRAEREKLQALWPRLEGARGRGGHADGVLRTDVEELVVELDPAAPAQNDIDLLGFGMAVRERAALLRKQAKVRDTGALGPERRSRDARFPAVAEAVPRGPASSSAAKLTIVNASVKEPPSVGAASSQRRCPCAWMTRGVRRARVSDTRSSRRAER